MTLKELIADRMIAAADGYADDEFARYGGELWLAGRLREEADDILEEIAA